MESYEAEENEVSGPLKHLLSLEWGTSPDISSVTKDVELNIKPLKQVKKVRFSDEIERNSYDNSYDLDDTLNTNEDIYDNTFIIDLSMSLGADVMTTSSVLETEKENKNDIAEELTIETNNSSITVDLENCVRELKNEDISDENHEKLECSNSLELNIKAEKVSTGLLNFKSEATSYVNLYTESTQISYVQSEIGPDEHILKEIASICIENNSVPASKFDASENHHGISSHKADDDKQIATVISPNKKKSHPNVCLQKQSEKINVLLGNSAHKFSSASEIKSAVFEAWNTVKKREFKNKKKYEIDCKNEKSGYSYKSNKYIAKETPKSWKRFKVRKQKKDLIKDLNPNLQFGDVQQELSKADAEEREMAFKSWKKRKDEITKQKVEKEHRKKQQEISTSLMNQQIKKEDAESAYFAWKAHKAETTEKDKVNKTKLMQKEREADEVKMERDKEALKMYYLWLESKHSKGNNYFGNHNNKPPWIPPGNNPNYEQQTMNTS